MQSVGFVGFAGFCWLLEVKVTASNTACFEITECLHIDKYFLYAILYCIKFFLG